MSSNQAAVLNVEGSESLSEEKQIERKMEKTSSWQLSWRGWNERVTRTEVTIKGLDSEVGGDFLKKRFDRQI